MSFFSKLTGFLRRNRNETTIETVTATPAPVNGSMPGENVLFVYSHGFSNGVYRLQPGDDHFQDYLQATSEADKVTELRKQNHDRLGSARMRLNDGMLAQQAVQEMLVDKTQSVDHLRAKMAEVDQQRATFQEGHRHLSERRNSIHAEYGWIPAFLYLVAGIVFIVGDISITHQITSWGFDMKGIEGWVFAVGLAFTAFLIKPVVDRFLEKPFQKAGLQLKMAYRVVLILITVLGVTMLFLLGKFRSESQEAATRLGDINYQMQALSDPNSAEYIRLAEARKKINEELTNNAVGEWGIILSGIIFAIGGALCLSIAFPSLTHLINRYWILPIRLKAVSRRIRELSRQRSDLKEELKQATGDILKAEHKLKGFNFARLHEEIGLLEEEEKRLLVEYYEMQFQREKSLYQDGKSRGEKYAIEGDLLYNAFEKDPTELYHKNGNGAARKENAMGSQRPFLRVRKMIADHYNKNQNNSSSDGSEFEILS